MKYWPADYWITLGTSGLLHRLDRGVCWCCWPGSWAARPAVSPCVGLAYGLATPAYVYATLAYGHQAVAFALLASFLLIRKKAAAVRRAPPRPRPVSSRRRPRSSSSRWGRCRRSSGCIS